MPGREDLSDPSGNFRLHALALLFFIVLFTLFFSPVIFSGQQLAPGDGILYYLPHYQAPASLWNPDSMTGFPEAADPQSMAWYMPAVLFSRLGLPFNLFVVSAYVLASWFTYLYVSVLTRHNYAALASGAVFGLSGFMMAHLGHVTIIHAVAWFPGVIWALEQVARKFRLRWVLIGGFIGSQCILSGHPQIAIYGGALAFAYAMFRTLTLERRRAAYCAGAAGMAALALIWAAPQILTTAELASLTVRSRLSFQDFTTYSLSPFQLATLVFPCLFGGAGATFLDGIPYFAAWGTTETAGYAGFAAMALALVALLWKRLKVVWFWVASGGLAVLAAMGGSTPLGQVLYHLPPFGKFRAQGRFIVIFCLALAVLAGCGIAALAERRRERRSSALPVLLSAAALLAAALAIGPLFGAQMREAAATQGFPNLPVMAWENRWIWIPLVSGAAVSALILLLMRSPDSRVWRGLLLAAMILELGSFGWFCEWRFASVPDRATRPSEMAEKCRMKLRTGGGRYLAVQGYASALDAAPPDVSAGWRLPALGKYGPLMPSRYSELLQMLSNGAVGQWWDPLDRAIDITGTRLVAFPADPAGTQSYQGIAFPAGDLTIAAGRACGATSDRRRILLQSPQTVSRIAVVSLMGCSVAYAQGTPVLEFRLHASDGRQSVVNLRAGIDSAEWAAGCEDVAPSMQHRPAEVFSRFPAARDRGVCQGQRYITFLDLPKPMPIESLEFQWIPQGPGIVQISKLVLLNGDAPARAVRSEDMWAGDASRWKEFAHFGNTAVYENLRAQPRAWIVPETVSLAPADIKRAIQTSKLPDGRDFDPAGMALIEEPLGLRSVPDAHDSAWIMEDRRTTLDIQTRLRTPGFLVLGDLYYPGWKATVNGLPARVFQTNYIQRGVFLPAGQNLVRFEFLPATLCAGTAMSGAGLLLAVAASIVACRKGGL